MTTGHVVDLFWAYVVVHHLHVVRRLRYVCWGASGLRCGADEQAFALTGFVAAVSLAQRLLALARPVAFTL